MPRDGSFESAVVVPGPVVTVLRRFGVPPLAEHKSGSQGLGFVAKDEIGFLPPAEQLPSSRKPGPAIAVAPGRTGAIYRALRTAAPYSSILLQPGIYTVRGGVGGGWVGGVVSNNPDQVSAGGRACIHVRTGCPVGRAHTGLHCQAGTRPTGQLCTHCCPAAMPWAIRSGEFQISRAQEPSTLNVNVEGLVIMRDPDAPPAGGSGRDDCVISRECRSRASGPLFNIEAAKCTLTHLRIELGALEEAAVENVLNSADEPLVAAIRIAGNSEAFIADCHISCKDGSGIEVCVLCPCLCLCVRVCVVYGWVGGWVYCLYYTLYILCLYIYIVCVCVCVYIYRWRTQRAQSSGHATSRSV